jgi:hypothetical protein
MQTRKSNTVNGVLTGLTAAGAITEVEAQAFRKDFLKPYTASSAWDDLVARFGLKEQRGVYVYSLPTERN